MQVASPVETPVKSDQKDLQTRVAQVLVRENYIRPFGPSRHHGMACACFLACCIACLGGGVVIEKGGLLKKTMTQFQRGTYSTPDIGGLREQQAKTAEVCASMRMQLDLLQNRWEAAAEGMNDTQKECVARHAATAELQKALADQQSKMREMEECLQQNITQLEGAIASIPSPRLTRPVSVPRIQKQPNLEAAKQTMEARKYLNSEGKMVNGGDL